MKNSFNKAGKVNKANKALLLACVQMFFLFVFATSAQSQVVDKAGLQLEINSLFQTIESNYGPLRLKSETVGLNWNSVKSHYNEKALSIHSSLDFYYTIGELFGELKDAHVSVSLPSNYEKELPLQFAYAEGKTIVNYAHSSAVKNCNLTAGDEVLLMDGKTPDEIREEKLKLHGMGNERADLAMTTMSMTVQKQAKGLDVSTDNSQVSVIRFKKFNSDYEFECEFKWKSKGVPLIPKNYEPTQSGTVLPLAVDATQDFQHKRSERWTDRLKYIASLHHKLVNLHSSKGQDLTTSNIFNDDEESGEDDGENNSEDENKKSKTVGKKITLGQTEPVIQLPKDFKPLKPGRLIEPLVANNAFTAGTFTFKNKTIGYLRIPSYVPQAIQFSQYGLRWVIAHLEKNSDLLIIDQTYNPGGYVAYSDWVIWSLTAGYDEAKHMTFAVKPTQGFLRTYAELMDTIKTEKEIPKNLKQKYLPLIERNFNIIKSAYDRGDELSEPIQLSVLSMLVEELMDQTIDQLLKENLPYIGKLIKMGLTKLAGGVDLLRPQYYKKPIFMLINELDFSGGDATPANLQDYGRVKLVGVGTAGAGGSVEEFNNRMINSFNYRLTTSLMIRSGKDKYVENYGVKPDIYVEPTISDYNDGFKVYLYRILATIM